MTKEEKDLCKYRANYMLSKGYLPNQIKSILEKDFGITPTTATKYLKEAIKELMEDSLTNDDMRLLLINRLERLGAKSEEKERYDWAIKSVDSTAKLLGLTESKSLEIQEGDKTFKVTFGE